MSRVTVPTYTLLKDMPKEMQEEVMSRGKLEINPSFNTAYMLVYGTLRWGLGNWSWCFQGRTKHIGTFAMKGFLKNKGISCQYTGNPNHETVMDLLEVIVEPEGTEKRKDFFAEVNSDTDGLEGVYWAGAGGYKSTAIPMEHEGRDIIAKFYNYNWTSEEVAESREDYAENTYVSWFNTPENKKSALWLEYMQNEAPTAWEFYKDLRQGKEKKTNSKIKLTNNEQV